MTRTSPMISVMLPMLGLMMIAGLFGLIMLGGDMVAETTYTTHQTIARANALNITKSTARYHVGAKEAWENYRNGVCENKQVYYNPVSGCLMISCQISGTNQCAQLIFQVTEKRFDVPRAMSPGRLTHAQIHRCGYINTYQASKGYTSWGEVAANIRDMITTAFGEP